MATPSQPSKRPASASAPIANKKVAKAARAGGGPSKRRRSGSDSYTLGVIGICVAGIALIAGSVYGRRIIEAAPYIGNRDNTTGVYQSKKIEAAQKELNKLKAAKKPDSKKIAAATKKFEALVSDTHWHSAYGIYNCDHWEPNLDATQFADTAGVHAHEDGLIHIHPFLNRAAGKNAKLGLFFDAVHITMNKNELQWPINTTGVAVPTAKNMKTLKTSDGCKDKNGKKVEAFVSVWKWDSDKDTKAEIYTGDFRTIPLVKSGAYAFVFAPKGTVVAIPASIKALEAPADQAASTSSTATSTTIAGATTTTVAGASTTTAAGATTTAPAGATTTAASGATTTAAAGVTTAAPTTATPTTAAAAATTVAPTTAPAAASTTKAG